MNARLTAAFRLLDSYNRQDPRLFQWEGQSYPEEYFFSLKLYEWVTILDPQASEALLLASRCQHIGRWEIPREHYPEGREAYLTWRKDLAAHHLSIASTLLSDAGYEPREIEAVGEILLKKKIKVNPDVQTMENALCLVFLQYQYEDFYPKYPDKIVQILRKSLLKMDNNGHQHALGLSFSEEGLRYIQEALQLIQQSNPRS